ncbi:MAG: hypothetical protein U5R06_20190 [candidate division KSB1 bacterium]|nr:hypothetical protein [candidate division KSB1 bacterium]
MNDLYYFSSLKVLCKITYAKEANSIRYTTDRPLPVAERKTIEQYILENLAQDTDYYDRTPSLLLYMGVNPALQKYHKQVQLKNTIKNVVHQKMDLDKKVKHLISESLSQYYFDKLGDKLLDLRHNFSDQSEQETDALILQIYTLLDAYNQNTGQDITLKSILPEEFKDRFEELLNNQ